MEDRIPYGRGTTTLELAADAEQTLENSRTYRPPSQSAATLLPEMAYKPSPYVEPQKKPKEDAKECKVAAAVGMKDPESENLEELLRRVIKQSFAEIASSSVEYPGKHASAGPRRGRGYQPPGRFGVQWPPNPNQTGKVASSRGNYAPSTNPGDCSDGAEATTDLLLMRPTRVHSEALP